MASKIRERIFISGARLSFPALDEPRETMPGKGDLKYQATFVLTPDNPSVEKIRKAIEKVARAEFGDKADAVIKSKEKSPLKYGNDKENIPDGYADNLYISAKTKYKPELRDANPRILITETEQIKSKFIAGYKVNGYIDLYPYAVKAPNGATIKSGIAAGLVSVQFVAYDSTFGGRGGDGMGAAAYPDESAACEASQAYNTSTDEDFDGIF